MTLGSILFTLFMCCLPVLGWAYLVTFFDDIVHEDRSLIWKCLIGWILTGGIIIMTHRYFQGNMFVFFGIAAALLMVTSMIFKLLIWRPYGRVWSYFYGAILFCIFFGGAIWWLIPITPTLSIVALTTILLPPCLEEVGKTLHTTSCSRNIRTLVISAFFVALGFSVIENILYLWGNWDTATYIGRNILSTPLHIIASILIARQIILHHSLLGFVYALSIGVGFHLLFNLTLWYSVIPMIILAIGYLFATKPVVRR